MDDDGLFFLESLRSEYVSPQPVFWAPTWGGCSTGELLWLKRSRGSEVGTVAVSQKAGAPQAVIPPCQGTVFELLQPKCQGTVLERTRRTAETNCLDCCTAASNSAWRFSRRLGGTVRKHAVAIEARFSLAS